MIIDACVFLGDSLYGNSLEPEKLIRDMGRYGIDKAVVRPFKPSDYNYDKANQYIARVQKDHQELIGFGRVNPLEKTAPRQVEALKAYGLRGLHLHPWEDNFIISDPKVYPVIEEARRQNLPVYVSAGYPNVSEPLQLWELADRYPEVTFIATHSSQLDMSGLSFDDALESAKRAKNIKFDLSGVYRRDFIELLINTAGEGNVLFGSCTPYMEFYLEIERIRAAQISDALKERLFHKNIAALLGL